MGNVDHAALISLWDTFGTDIEETHEWSAEEVAELMAKVLLRGSGPAPKGILSSQQQRLGWRFWMEHQR